MTDFEKFFTQHCGLQDLGAGYNGISFTLPTESGKRNFWILKKLDSYECQYEIPQDENDVFYISNSLSEGMIACYFLNLEDSNIRYDRCNDQNLQNYLSELMKNPNFSYNKPEKGKVCLIEGVNKTYKVCIPGENGNIINFDRGKDIYDAVKYCLTYCSILNYFNEKFNKFKDLGFIDEIYRNNMLEVYINGRCYNKIEEKK